MRDTTKGAAATSGKLETIWITILYVFMGAGALWHYLGWFSQVMTIMAGPTMIVTALLAGLFYFRDLSPARRRDLLIWMLLVFILAMLAEAIGTHTGLIFGPYTYASTLQPQVYTVPIAIGFAWILLLLTGNALGHRFLREFHTWNSWSKSVFIGLSMTAFDLILEPAAMQLNYWQWLNDSIPLRNYVAWFVLGTLFAWLGFKLGALHVRPRRSLIHFYGAQLLYLALVLFAGVSK
jgi:uncharacterized membrane protein